MTTPHESYEPAKPLWTVREPAAAEAEIIRQSFRNNAVLRGDLPVVVQKLAESPDTSLTVFHTPWAMRLTHVDMTAVMLLAARSAAGIIVSEGLDLASGTRHLREIQRDDLPQELSELTVPPEAMGYLGYAGRIGYLRVAQVADRYQATVGCLEDSTGINHALTIDTDSI